MFRFVKAQFQKLLKPMIGQPHRRANRNRTAELVENLEFRCLLTAHLLQAPVDAEQVSVQSSAVNSHSRKASAVPDYAGTYQFSSSALGISGTLTTTQSGKTTTTKLTVGSASITFKGTVNKSGHLTGTLKNIQTLVSQAPAKVSAKFDAFLQTPGHATGELTIGAGKKADKYSFTANKKPPTALSSFDGYYYGSIFGTVVGSQGNSIDFSSERLNASILNGVVSSGIYNELAVGSGTLTSLGDVSFTTVDSERGFSLQFTGTLEVGPGFVGGNGSWTVISAQSPGFSGNGSWDLYRTAPVVVSVQATDPSATEGSSADPGVFTITRSGPTTDPLIVNFYTDGDASIGEDYTDPGDSVVIPAGSSSVTVTINPLANGSVNTDAHANLVLGPSKDFDYGIKPTAARATVTIFNTSPS